VDPASWSQLSLEAIRGAETGRQSGGSCQEGAQEGSSAPGMRFPAPSLHLISDPAIKAKIRSLQLVHWGGNPLACQEFEERACGPGLGFLRGRRQGGRSVRAVRGEREGEEGDCETPESEGTPLPWPAASL